MSSRDVEQGTFEHHLAEVNLSGARAGYGLAAVLMPAGAFLDIVTHPEYVASFAVIRGAACAVSLALLAAMHLPWVKRQNPVLLGAGPPLICAIAIEIMVERLGGSASPYYAGLNLCILSVGVLYTWHWRHAVAVCGAIVFLWVTPSLPGLFLGHVDLRAYVNNLYFLLLTTVISVASTVIRFRLARREFDARRQQELTSAVLAETLKQLQQLDRMKNEFFANISHELRTPLTLILAPVEEILAQPPPVPNESDLKMVRRNAERLLRLINDLLDLARLEAGGMRLNVALVDPSELAERVVDSARPTAHARSLDLVFESDGAMGDMFGDPHRLEIVITNLLGNALKFTPAGGRIVVRVTRANDGVSIEIADDGPGIPEKDLHRIFERFYQVEGSERRAHGGTGIGLALASELMELHGGALSVESTAGQGATFRMWLPGGRERFKEQVVERRRVRVEDHPSRRAEDKRAPENGATATTVPAVLAERVVPAAPESGAIVLDRGRRPRIVVAEDEDDLREFIREMFAPDFEVFTATDGKLAIELVKKERPDLVISDVMMPRSSGIDLCRTIKSDPALARIPVILLTAGSSSDATLAGYSAGADDFVSKPFHTRVLVARVRAQLKLQAMSLRLAQTARLTSAGTLAAGVAHEVRNPLGAIINAAEVLAEHTEGTPQEKLVRVIGDAAGRILAIASALDEHVRPGDGTGRVEYSDTSGPHHDVRAGIESTLRLLDYRMGGINVHTDFATDAHILAPAREFNQVILNLLENAVRAKPESIWIAVHREGSKIFVRVADDGVGVSHDIAERIFDPFFTTRTVGEGSGLGLYLARRTVTEHGGDLRLQGKSGPGAEFVIEMPAEGRA